MGKKRSDSKFDKKVQFYSKVKDAVTSLSAKKSITSLSAKKSITFLSAKKSVTKKKSRQQRRQNKKLKAYNLSSLLESLPEVKASQKPDREAGFKLNCKSRQNLLLEERDRFSKFLKDPDFQADPLSAIHQHLQNRQPVVEEQPKKKVNKNGSKKKKKSKASTRPQSMEM